MKKIGIAVDWYKRKIFRRELKRAGFTWEESQGITPDSILMTVPTDAVDVLHRVVRTCEAQAQRKHKHG